MHIPPDSLFATHPLRVAKQQEVARSKLENTFIDLLQKGIGSVNEAQMTSSDQVNQLLTGKDVNSAEVLTGIQKADMSFRLLVQVRNKLMRAFEELNNIRI